MARKETIVTEPGDGTRRFEEVSVADHIPDYAITWSANAPTAGDSATIADGDSPTVAETGQAIQDLTAKLNLALAALRRAGLLELS